MIAKDSAMLIVKLSQTKNKFPQSFQFASVIDRIPTGCVPIATVVICLCYIGFLRNPELRSYPAHAGQYSRNRPIQPEWEDNPIQVNRDQAILDVAEFL